MLTKRTAFADTRCRVSAPWLAGFQFKPDHAFMYTLSIFGEAFNVLLQTRALTAAEVRQRDSYAKIFDHLRRRIEDAPRIESDLTQVVAWEAELVRLCYEADAATAEGLGLDELIFGVERRGHA